MSQHKETNKRRRRPGRDPEETIGSSVSSPEETEAKEEQVQSNAAQTSTQEFVDAHEDTMAANAHHTSSEEQTSATQQNGHDGWGDDLEEPSNHDEKTRLEFYGSELIRLKAPKVMEVADQVVHDWTHDGSFEGLPVGHPLAQIAVAKGLQTAKQVERKLEEKGVFALAKMGIELAKSKLKNK
ncbi:MAG: hypothetical protein ACLGGX_11355 [Bdellovibrionia bacterium]